MSTDKMVATGTQQRVGGTLDEQYVRQLAPAEKHRDNHPCYYWGTDMTPNDNLEWIHEELSNPLEERIMDKEIPKFLGKQGAGLLTEVTQSWPEFEAFAESLGKSGGYPALYDVPMRCFSTLVCERLYGKIQEATMSLIVQDREGKEIDKNLLKAVFRLFLVLRGKKTTDYYAKLEQTMLAEASAYYSELSMQWWFWHDSYTNYLRKVDWCLVQEEARAEPYLCGPTKAKLLEVMKYIFLERTVKRWTQKQKDGGVRAEDQRLLSKYVNLSLDNGESSANAALASDQ